MGDECADRHRIGDKSNADGVDETETVDGFDIPLGSRGTVLQQGISGTDTSPRNPTEHEQKRRLLGQCTGRIVFQDVEERIMRLYCIQNEARGARSDL